MGFGHLIIDLLMMVPFIGAFIFWLKVKFKGKKNENKL